MTRRELFQKIRKELSTAYPPREAEAIALRLLEHFSQLDRAAICLEPRAEATENRALNNAVVELLHGRPLQYVLGETEFCGLRLTVDGRVLIPRPETEELVRWIAEAQRGRAGRILDIGTGSGAIAIALANELPDAELFAIDISEDALDVARQNAAANGVRVRYSRCDILTEKPDGKFDVIVSNPPYVRTSERAAMRGNVLNHEPPAALFVPDDDPLLFYRRIAAWGLGALNSGGEIYFEINEALGRQTEEGLASQGYKEVELRQDIFGKDRMIKALRS